MGDDAHVVAGDQKHDADAGDLPGMPKCERMEAAPNIVAARLAGCSAGGRSRRKQWLW